jgi:acyl carrier protein
MGLDGAYQLAAETMACNMMAEDAGAASTPSWKSANRSGSIADTPDRLLALIDQLAAELRPSARLRARLDSRLDKDLGLDSLARVELLARVERSFGCRLDEALLGSAETPRDLLAALHGGDSAAPSMTHLRREAVTAIDEERPESAQTLVDVLAWHAQRHPDRPHVLFQRSATETETFTYGQLLASARQVAAGPARARRVRG